MSKKIEAARDRRITEPMFRSMQVVREGVDTTTRTVRLAFASDAPVDHWMGPLILSTKKKNVRSERMANGLALLDNHDRSEQIGIVENFSFDSDGMIRGDARFSKSDDADEIFQDVVDGIKRFVSVGFMIYELHVDNEKDNVITYRCDDWEPFEVSIVSVPADYGVGVGRSMAEVKPATRDDGEDEGDGETCPECELPMAECECEPEAARSLPISNASPALYRGIPNNGEMKMTPEEIAAAAKAAEEQRKAEMAATRRSEIVAFADIYGERQLAEELLLASLDATIDDVRTAIQAKRAQNKLAIVPPLAPAEAAAREGEPVQLARSVYRGGQLKAFKGERGHEKAFRAGQFILATIGRQEQAAAYCRENGILIERAHGGGTNSLGGFLVPDEFDATMIDLRVEYGVFRANTNVVPMSRDTQSRPRRTGGLTAYGRTSGTATTESTKNWDNVTLVAKLWSVLTKYENELSEDAVVNIGDDLVSEIAYAFAAKEDDCGFNGDGSDTYEGIVGVRNKLLNLGATRADIAGAQVASGNAWSEIVLADIQGLVGRLPQFARRTGGVKFYCSNEFFANVLMRLAQAVGGVTAGEIAAGFAPRFFGIPVEITEAMPHTEANDVICLLYGNLAQASMLGDRKGTSIAMTDSDSTDFAKGIMAIRGDTRFDINVHDVGNYDATAANRKAGPIVGLLTAAS